MHFLLYEPWCLILSYNYSYLHTSRYDSHMERNARSVELAFITESSAATLTGRDGQNTLF